MAVNSHSLFKSIKVLVENARTQVVQSINITLAETYYNIGKSIIEYEQKGFSADNFEYMRRFYLLYSNFRESVSEIF